jgi:hypothetical protein
LTVDQSPALGFSLSLKQVAAEVGAPDAGKSSLSAQPQIECLKSADMPLTRAACIHPIHGKPGIGDLCLKSDFNLENAAFDIVPRRGRC